MLFSINLTRQGRFFKNIGLLALVVSLALSLATTLATPPAARAAGVVTDCVNFAGANTLGAALAGGGNITFACSGTIVLPARIVIAAPTTIDGAGNNVTLSGNNVNGLFRVNPGVTLSLRGLKLENGLDAALPGGAIHNWLGVVNIERSLLAYNRAPLGGAIYSHGGQVNVKTSTFLKNRANDGGAIYATEEANVTVSGSTFIENQADGFGGAIKMITGQLWTSNSTFTQNTAVRGGAIYNADAEVRLINSTLSENTALLGSNIFNLAPFMVVNSIVANPLGGGLNCNGLPVANAGNNLQWPGMAPDCNGMVVANPLLLPLANNGGPTRTMALAAASPAIDTANNAVCAGPVVNNLDQRGVVRPRDGNGDAVFICDIGAFER